MYIFTNTKLSAFSFTVSVSYYTSKKFYSRYHYIISLNWYFHAVSYIYFYIWPKKCRILDTFIDNYLYCLRYDCSCEWLVGDNLFFSINAYFSDTNKLQIQATFRNKFFLYEKKIFPFRLVLSKYIILCCLSSYDLYLTKRLSASPHLHRDIHRFSVYQLFLKLVVPDFHSSFFFFAISYRIEL